MRWWPLLFALPATIAGGANARAACRTTTVDNQDPSYNAVKDGCWKVGFPLWWRNACIGYSIQRDGTPQIAFDEVSSLITQAFTRWTSAACLTDESGRSRPSIDVRDLGPVACSKVELAPFPQPNQNAIVFRQTWPKKQDERDRTILGLTKVQFLPSSGEILGADIEINMEDLRPFKTAEPLGGDEYDLLAVLTHEVGHFFGIAHSDIRSATMYADVDRGQSFTRRLSPDDVEAICDIYRPNGDRVVLDGKVTGAPQCDPTPRGGFTSECAETGCAFGGHLGSPFVGVLVALALLARRIKADVA